MKKAINGENKVVLILSILLFITFIGVLFGNMLGKFMYYIFH